MNLLVKNSATIFLLFLLSLSCKDKNDSIQPEIKKGCKEATKVSYRNGILSEKWVYEYDDRFYLKKEFYYSGNSNTASVLIYEYEHNPNGQIAKTLIKWNGTVLSTIHNTYHNNGQIKSEEVINQNFHSISEYDDMANQVRDYFQHSNTVSEWTKNYDENGNILKSQYHAILDGVQNNDFVTNYIYKNGLLDRKDEISIFPGNGRIITTTYKYNSQKKLELETIYDTPEHIRYEKYEYNSAGLLSSKISYSEDSSVKIFTKYDYNANGLLTRESYGNNIEPYWWVDEYWYFPSGKKQKYVSYFQTLDILSETKKPQEVVVWDDRGNGLENTLYDISGQKIMSFSSTYTCRD